MANPLTINRQPEILAPAFGDLTFEVISTNNTQPQFKYIFELHSVDGLIDVIVNTSKLYPDPNGFARYNPNKILQAYLYNINTNGISAQSNAYAGETLQYYVKFSEEYIYANVLTTFYRLSSFNKYVWMGAPDWEDGKDLITYTAKFTPLAANHLLTNAASYLGPKMYNTLTGPQPSNSYTIRPDEKRTVSLLVKDMVNSYYPTVLNVITILKTPVGNDNNKIFRFNFIVSSSTQQRYLMKHQPIGLAELNAITWTSTNIPAGRSATISTTEDAAYMVWFSNGASILNITHKPINFIIDECTRYDHYTVMYKSKDGGYWYIPMNMKHYKTENMEQSTMDTFLPYNYSSNDSVTKTIAVKTRGEILLTSDWLNQYQVEEFMDMKDSTSLFLSDKNNKYIPVTVKPGAFTKPTVNQDKMVQYEITFIEAFNKNTLS
jgi:hypothetical protein